MISYATLTAILGIFSACFIFWLVRRNYMHPSYAIWWTIVGMVVALAGLFPRQLDTVAYWFGVTYPPTLFLVLVILVLLFRLLMGDIARTRMEARLRRLTQREAMLACRLRLLEEHFALLKKGE